MVFRTQVSARPQSGQPAPFACGRCDNETNTLRNHRLLSQDAVRSALRPGFTPRIPLANCYLAAQAIGTRLACKRSILVPPSGAEPCRPRPSGRGKRCKDKQEHGPATARSTHTTLLDFNYLHHVFSVACKQLTSAAYGKLNYVCVATQKSSALLTC